MKEKFASPIHEELTGRGTSRNVPGLRPGASFIS
jgi:hypothetical protein